MSAMLGPIPYEQCRRGAYLPFLGIEPVRGETSASEVTTLWRYSFIIIIIIFYTPGSIDPRG